MIVLYCIGSFLIGLSIPLIYQELMKGKSKQERFEESTKPTHEELKKRLTQCWDAIYTVREVIYYKDVDVQLELLNSCLLASFNRLNNLKDLTKVEQEVIAFEYTAIELMDTYKDLYGNS